MKNDIKGSKKWLIIAIMLALALVVVDVLSNKVLQILVDALAQNDWHRGITAILFVCLIFVFGALMKYGSIITNAKFNNDVMEKMRSRLVRCIVKSDYKSICKEGNGSILSVFNNEIVQINGFLENFSNNIYTVILLVVASIYLTLVNWKLFLVCFGFVPFVLFLVYLISKPIDTIMGEFYQTLGEANEVVSDTIGGITEIKMFSLFSIRNRKYYILLKNCFSQQKKMEKRFTLILFLMILVNEIPVLLCLVGGIYLGIPNGMSVGDVVAYIQLLRLIIQPVIQFSGIIQQWKSVKGAFSRITILSELSAEGDSDDKVLVNSIDSISMKNLAFEYTKDLPVLSDISLNLVKGKSYAFVGVSGSGKSTLFKILAGLFNNVDFYVNSNVCVKECVDSYRKKIAYVSQNSYLFNDTVMNNMLYANTKANENEIVSVLKEVNAYSFVNEKENGMATILCEGGENLSGGERQRLTIARAILKDSDVIILDEPTAELDVATEKKIMDYVMDKYKDKIIIISAHRFSSITNVDEIFVIEDGRIVESGNHQELIEYGNKYYELYKAGKESRQ